MEPSSYETTLNNPIGHSFADTRRQRVLLVDDDRMQLKLSALRLRRAGFIVTTATSAREALALATTDTPDAVLSDVVMREVDGFSLCEQMRLSPQLGSVPIILLSAHYGDAQARELARKVGAVALVSRTPSFQAELQALSDALGQERASGKRLVAKDVTVEHLRTNAHELAKLADVARVAGDRYRALFENATDVIALLSRSGVVVEANHRWTVVLGVPLASILGKHLLDFASGPREAIGAELDAAIARGAGAIHALAIEQADGGLIYLDFSITVIDAEEPLVLVAGRDVTDRVLSARRLTEAEEKYRSLVERMPEVVWSAAAGVVTFVTWNVESLTGFTAAEIYAADSHFWPQRVHHDDRERYMRATQPDPTQGQGAGFDLRYRWRRKDGTWVWVWHRTNATYDRGGVRHMDGLISDITERRLLEESLRQSQKMDALGQLTGGIAHDFNNILAVILGNSQFLIEALAEDDPRRVDAEEIMLAAERAAGLTRQLLAFSRRQVLEFHVTDLNLLVVGMERLLRRLIGTDIQTTVVLGDGIGKVFVDSGQIEQVVMNLALNARDAMPRGGTLTIETANAEDPRARPADSSKPPGGYVVLSVSDTGTGMDEQTLQRIFEPFFTTKEVGRGTGLGLATCHGIVTQSGGHIRATSELACGSVFKVYLPRVDAEVTKPGPGLRSAASPVGGKETVLLVEDDPQVRTAVARMLRSQGYHVIAANAVDALELAKLQGATIALLLTDIVMPTLSGPDLASAVLAVAPHIKVLFMSGHTNQALLTSGEPMQSASFIQKPFAPSALASKLRQTLEGEQKPTRETPA